jgi:hypothetical protein
MSDVQASQSGDVSLDFTRAQFSDGPPPPTTCAACNQPLTHEYFQVNGEVTCRTCRDAAEAELESGSAFRRFIFATVLGIGAGFVGCAIYWLVGWLTGYEFGLIAIVVGFLVGTAVRKGSSRRGGLPYQLLAVGLTYAAIAGTTIPDIVGELRKQAAAESAESGEATAPQLQTAATMQTQADSGSAIGSSVGLVVFGALVFAIAMAVPFLAGFQNILGIIIIAIGLYEAWKLNPRFRLEVTGPYQVGPATAGPTAAALT